MKRTLVIIAALVVAAAAGVSGFWFGVREGTKLASMVDSAPRGMISLHNIRALDAGKTGNLRILFESDIDSALMWWDTLSSHPLRPVLGELLGFDPMPYSEKYIRELAVYRRDNPSPLVSSLEDPRVLENLARNNPQLAQELVERGRDTAEAIRNTVNRYAQ